MPAPAAHLPQRGHGVVGQLVHALSSDLVELQVREAHLAREAAIAAAGSCANFVGDDAQG